MTNLKCDHELVKSEIKGVAVERCSKCNGIWFDRDELRKAKDSTDEDLRFLDFEIFDTKNKKIQKGESSCPKCGTKMETLEYMNSGVKIDRCSSCHGVFLDKGEFKKIISFLENLIISKSSGEYLKDTGEELKEILTGPEDTISEIKDFLAVLNLLELKIQAEHPKVSEMLITFARSWPIR